MSKPLVVVVEDEADIQDVIAYNLKRDGYPGRAFSREQLLNRVVGDAVVVVDRNIDVHIRSVRKKLGDQTGLIETVRGVGYRFADQ